MNIVWGGTLVLLGALAWAGQLISWLSPLPAARLGLTEREDDVDPVFWADVRGEAAWDSFTLWTLIAAGALLIADSSAWASWGLIAGGTYLYFAGRGLLVRRAMLRRGFRIGKDAGTAMVFLTIWGVASAVTIAAALIQLS